MDVPFDVAQWQPTIIPELGDSELSEADLLILSQSLSEQTKEILRHPYEPNIWLRRANTLTKLRYPELALGDAYKTSTLCRAHLSHLEDGNRWHLGYRMGFWMYDEAPEDETRVEMLQEYLANCQSRARKLEVKNMFFFPDYEEGRFRRRPYAWMSDRHRRRSDELLELVNREFAESETNVLDDEAPCMVKRHAFGESVGCEDTNELLGVFAKCDVGESETVLVDTSRFWGCNGPGRHGDCTGLSGERCCYNLIHPNSESDDVQLDLRWIRDRAGKMAASVILSCKLLLCCIQDDVAHPLDHPVTARLTPNYGAERVSNVSLEHDIAIPNEGLQQFGIDIFANPNFDTWVLFTIEARALNNSCGDPMVASLNPLFSLFNHSCEPNVDWSTSRDHRTIRVKALRSIRSGEQLFVAYDGFITAQPLQVRRKRMLRWLNDACQCTRCVREERELEERGVNGGSVSEVGKPDWDLEDKPVFPEDALMLKNQRSGRAFY